MGMARNGAGRMAGQFGDRSMRVLFGKAFLLELERGNVDSARIFARAFLAHVSGARVTDSSALT